MADNKKRGIKDLLFADEDESRSSGENEKLSDRQLKTEIKKLKAENARIKKENTRMKVFSRRPNETKELFEKEKAEHLEEKNRLEQTIADQSKLLDEAKEELEALNGKLSSRNGKIESLASRIEDVKKERDSLLDIGDFKSDTVKNFTKLQEDNLAGQEKLKSLASDLNEVAAESRTQLGNMQKQIKKLLEKTPDEDPSVYESLITEIKGQGIANKEELLASLEENKKQSEEKVQQEFALLESLLSQIKELGDFNQAQHSLLSEIQKQADQTREQQRSLLDSLSSEMKKISLEQMEGQLAAIESLKITSDQYSKDYESLLRQFDAQAYISKSELEQGLSGLKKQSQAHSEIEVQKLNEVAATIRLSEANLLTEFSTLLEKIEHSDQNNFNASIQVQEKIIALSESSEATKNAALAVQKWFDELSTEDSTIKDQLIEKIFQLRLWENQLNEAEKNQEAALLRLTEKIEAEKQELTMIQRINQLIKGDNLIALENIEKLRSDFRQEQAAYLELKEKSKLLNDEVKVVEIRINELEDVLGGIEA